MKTLLNFCLSVITILGTFQITQAQCSFSNFFNSTITLSGSATSSVTCVQGGQYVAVSVTSGETYNITTCNSTSGGDSQITLFNSTNTATSVGYNDDDCGLFSTVTYTATFTGTLYIQVNEYNCVTSTTCYNLQVTCTTCGGGGSSCSYTLDLFDTFGDGWNGASLDVIVNGVVANNYTFINGFSATFNFSVNSCDVVVLSFNSGTFDNEISYDLYQNPNLTTPIFSADYTGGTTLTGAVFTTTCGGAACGGPVTNNISCDSMAPICTSTGINFTTQVSGVDANTAFPGPDYGCLGTPQFGTAPDPTFWYLEISQAGNLDMLLSAPADIDFIVWGPYADLNAALNSCGAMGTAPTATNGSIIDCSYDPTNNETPSITGALVGQVYIMMVTNYAGSQQNVSLTQTGGTAATNCSIVNPPVTCNADAGTVTTIVNGSTTTANPIILCRDDCFSIETDSNFVMPDSVTGEQAELMYALYTSMPDTNATNPDQDPAAFTGLFWTGGDFSDCNDAASIIITNGLGPQTWFVPITMDDGDNNSNPNGAINYDNNGDSCYDVGYDQMVEVIFLDSIDYTVTDNCSNVVITLTGGLPGFNPTAGSYTVVNTGPGTVTQSGASGEILTFTGYTQGQTLSFTVSNDGNGCQKNITYTTNVPIAPTLDNIVNTTCAGNIGEVNISMGGTCTYTLDMFDSFGDGWNGGNLAITVGGVAVAGSPFAATGFGSSVTFTANVGQVISLTYSSGSFESENSYDLYQDGVLVFSDGPSPTTGNVFTVTCNPPTSYNWSNGATTQDITGLAAGSYTVTVTDQNGCTATAGPFTVTTTNGANASIANVTDASCAGATDGGINITVSGGTTPYSYSWSNTTSNEDLTGVGAGTYTVTVSDAGGCTVTLTGTVNEPSAIAPSNTATDASCNGATDGSVDLTVSGGTPGYTYNWSNSPTTQDITGVGAGTYTVTITDGNGCTVTETAVVGEPTAITSSSTTTDASCGGGTNGAVDLTVSGGSPGYTYLWSNSATTQDITGVGAGTYTVTITDNNGCTATASANVNTPSGITLTNTTTDVNCNGDLSGGIDINVAGGTAPFNYNWSNSATTEDITGVAAGIYTVTITDGNSCTSILTDTITEPTAYTTSSLDTDVDCNGASNGAIDLTVSGATPGYSYSWSNTATSEDISGLSGGTYTVTVSDANGCTTTLSTTINEPTALVSATDSTVDATCSAGGAVFINVSGGTAGYTFNWSNGNTTEDITGVTAGTYTVTITDNNGCTITNGPNTVNSVGVQTVSINTSADASCNGATDGSIDINVSGGTAPYTYNWDNAATTQDITGLGAGVYNVTVTDDLGCTANLGPITITEPSAISVTNTSSDVTCNGANDGTINITVSGGTAGYTFNWDNGSTNEDLTNIPGGSYTVTVTDLNGCTSIQGPITINEPTALIPNNITIDTASCANNDGGAGITVSGGTSPYSYNWSNGATTASISGVAAGTYTVTYNDANGCGSVATITIPSGSDVSIAVDSTDDETCAQNDAGAGITISGGDGNYTFLWSNGSTTEDLGGVTGGTYVLTVTDGNGCTAVDSVSLAGVLVPSVAPFVEPAGTDSIDVDITSTLNGGNDQSGQGVNYTWSYTGPADPAFDNANAHNTNITPTQAGSYTFTILATSAEGCTDSASIEVEVNPALDPKIPDAFTPDVVDANENHIFKVENLDPSLISEFRVYNRWGQKIYDNATEAGWDGTFKGTDQPRDVYIYIITWRLPQDTEDTVVRGQVTLLR